MRTSFVSYVKNRFLLAALAYEMLDRGLVEKATETNVRSMVSTLLAESDNRRHEMGTVDEFLQRVCTSELLSLKDSVVQWQSAKTQAYLAALNHCRRPRNISWRDKQKTARWLRERATLTQWHDPITLMSYYVRDGKEASRFAELLAKQRPLWQHTTTNVWRKVSLRSHGLSESS